MVSMLTFCSDIQQLLKIEKITKRHAAILSDDKWVMDFYNKIEEFKERIIEGKAQDIICYELEDDEGIDYAKYIRKSYEKALLILMADNSISPMKYIRPDIMPAGLIVQPASADDLYRVFLDVFESYVSSIVKKCDEGAYIISKKDRKVTIPYSSILYFEARNKKVYIRYEDKEIGFCDSLESVEEDLNEGFVRTHRSYIVNRKMIRKIMISKNTVLLKNKLEVPLSRKYKSTLKLIEQTSMLE